MAKKSRSKDRSSPSDRGAPPRSKAAREQHAKALLRDRYFGNVDEFGRSLRGGIRR